MKRVAIIFSVISGAILILGLVEDLTNFKWSAGDQNTFFGNPNVVINDGKTALIAGGFLAIFSVVMWVLAVRKGGSDQRQS